ncbi:glucose-1-phosphate adenylyltransferase [Jatrophihabitans endophyticus]|uniref:Glucose-1-phosphate adenylyltransferase n=1 Tax=Jatrophihabitans endophyticus TaxID=1206085 RepID=A0A1M5EUN7_9ACTN|nr:glucose-1-phosphate adenylyltransferase family protein [Jatrophihabitans endophyticus]SHF82943.1 glucose-1-phosphate adenylyltransferase [Jatrophihabitans endophyticus]
MPRPDVLVLVLAGGKGSRLDLLTANRAKPAVPFAGSYRLIDFPLSNCLHSNIADVWVLQQYQPASLNDHLANGRPWDLDRTTGGLLVLPPYQGSGRGGFTQGTADGLWRNAQLIRDVEPRTVVIVSADAVYRLDYADVVRGHRESDAVMTMVTTRVDRGDASRYGVVQIEGDDEVDGARVSDYAYKPDEPKSDLVSNEVFVFEPDHVLSLLERLADEATDPDEEGLGDLGDALLPALVDEGVVRQHRHREYWRDVGTIEAYWASNMDFIAAQPPIDLDDEQWVIRTQGGHRSPAWFADSGTASGSLVGASARVAGTVTRSVLSPGVVVEEGAHVEDSVLLPGVVVRAGAHVRRSVVDDSVEIGRGAIVGGDDGIALLGDFVSVPPGERIEAGARYPAEDHD